MLLRFNNDSVKQPLSITLNGSVCVVGRFFKFGYIERVVVNWCIIITRVAIRKYSRLLALLK